MKRLLSVSVTGGSDSTGRIAALSCRGAMEAGREVLLAYGRGSAPADVPSVSLVDRPGMLLHGMATRLADRHGLSSKAATFRLIDTIENFSPDVIHLHNIHGYYLHYPTLFEYLARTGVPTVWTLHDVWPMTGHCAFFKDCGGWLSGCRGRCPERAAYPAALFSKSARNYDLKAKYFNLPGLNLHLVGVSEWITDIVKRSLLSQHPVSTILNGVDTDLFHPLEGPSGQRILLGVANGWEARKGASDFARLAHELDPSWRIRMVGVPSAMRHRLPSRIETVPHISDAHLLAADYARATVFANLTYDDNCPLTELEALSCGTPVVAYTSGGAPECITPQCGRVVVPGADIPTLTQAIEEAATLSRTDCRSIALKRYAVQTMQAAYLELYDRMVPRMR